MLHSIPTLATSQVRNNVPGPPPSRPARSSRSSYLSWLLRPIWNLLQSVERLVSSNQAGSQLRQARFFPATHEYRYFSFPSLSILFLSSLKIDFICVLSLFERIQVFPHQSLPNPALCLFSFVNQVFISVFGSPNGIFSSFVRVIIRFSRPGTCSLSESAFASPLFSQCPTNSVCPAS